jgi:hypothetical protein
MSEQLPAIRAHAVPALIARKSASDVYGTFRQYKEPTTVNFRCTNE